MGLLGAHFTYLAVLSSGPHLEALRNAWRTCDPACAYTYAPSTVLVVPYPTFCPHHGREYP